MKKFIIIVAIVVAAYIFGDFAYYRLGWYLSMNPKQKVTTFVKTEGKNIYLEQEGIYEPFEIQGVDLGTGLPGEWSTDFAIEKETYLRWFEMMQEMGANTVRVYTIQDDTFYDAFYEYNVDNPEPLYLLHGLWVNDYIQYSHVDAYDEKFSGRLMEDVRVLVDVIHGNKKISIGRYASAGSGTYDKDISQWVIGYILGVEWEGTTVAYTNELYKDNEAYNSFVGDYVYATEDATPFETMLAQVGNQIVGYESKRYGQQRLLAFSNWPTTDPFEYPEEIAKHFQKCSSVDVEHIKCTDEVVSGQFASYHIYPYHPDYMDYVEDWSVYGISDKNSFYEEDGALNTYKAYLTAIVNHHSIPVVIAEFGVSTGRGMAQFDFNTGRNQGHMSEQEQGEALIACYEDIMESGAAGSCVFSWQDEWFKRTWNTIHAVDLTRTPYWSDYQTNEQFFGLLSFDPGEETSICYVDGDVSEWQEEDIVCKNENSSLAMKYDEKFLYLMIERNNLDFENDILYVPIDTTPKSGSSYCENYGLTFDRATDFLLVINGSENSRLLVQERYEALRSTFSQYIYEFDTYVTENIPDIDSPLFKKINFILKYSNELKVGKENAHAEVYETGDLMYGNANPESVDYNSLADFISKGDYIEIKIPWQLLNFSDPSRMMIHDDYYVGAYGIEYINIDSMYIGLSDGTTKGRISLTEIPLKGWGNQVTYHERLKPSYYILQSVWKED